jgi:uncharacterized protein (DUF1919 family)
MKTNLPWSEAKIDDKEGKQWHFQQIKAFCEARPKKWRERELHVHIKEMYIHMRETKLEEEKKRFDNVNKLSRS